MDKKELIESIAHLPSDCSRPRPMIDKLTTLELIKLLDEPQKATVPQYVAAWIEKCKSEKGDCMKHLLIRRLESMAGYLIQITKKHSLELGLTATRPRKSGTRLR